MFLDLLNKFFKDWLTDFQNIVINCQFKIFKINLSMKIFLLVSTKISNNFFEHNLATAKRTFCC